ncbi:calcium-translocating P-type ATPase, SERCA-type [Candidatus Woesearchaeota archaeon]|nr:calcium-translocating P-type ATPase, SERCA-type [Candidatus Woesearchaeota archaeon]
MSGKERSGFTSMAIDDALEEVGSSDVGITSKEATKRLESRGPNELDKKRGKTPFQIFLSQFKGFIIYMLFAAAFISALLGEWTDAIVIFVIIIINAIMGFIQEFKAERSLEALQRMASLKAVVLRDGKRVKVDARELVPGDVIVLESGSKIPADARLLEAVNLQVEEGALTGESVPVDKKTGKLKKGLSLGDQANMVFSGTIVTNGRGRAVVTATGMGTQIGRIAGMLESTGRERTPLQKKLAEMGKVLGYITIAVCLIVFATGWIRGGDVKEMFLTAVSLAVAAIPSSLPAVITIALGFGVQRMIKRHVLIRKLPSVETLGAVTVICSDKTGTLTHNQMTVTKVFVDGKVHEVSGSGYEPKGEVEGSPDSLLFCIGALCNDARLSKKKKHWNVIGDPTEGCLLTAARKAGLDEERLWNSYPRLDELGFDSERKMMTTFHEVGGKRVSYTKGAPDVVLSKCSRIRVDGKVQRLTEKRRQAILDRNREFSEQALRVLAFAYDEGKSKSSAEKGMVFVGLQAMIDPPREEVKQSIAKCKEAGIRVVMITGDHLTTAKAIADDLGIPGRAVEGKDIASMDLSKEVGDIGVFARVNPEHKLDIVKALKKQGHIVAMTGDGVNDAPALKQSDVGVAMGVTGTDVSKEASSMILTDDNFTSIVSAVEEGRSIYDNIKKFINYLLSSNMGEVLLLFVAMLIGFTFEGAPVLPLAALQILLVNLITDGLPALALGVDPADPGIMKRKPRNPKSHIINRNMAWNIGVIGVLITIAVLFVFDYGLSFGVAKGQTMALTMLIILEIVRLEMIRSQYHTSFFSNKWLTLSIVVVLALQLFLIYVPSGLREIFGLVPLSWVDWTWILVTAAVMFVLGKFAAIIIKRTTHTKD